MIESVRHVRKTDLARNTRDVINAVLRGETAFIESHGKPEAAIIDIVDYRLLRAVMRYHARKPEVDARGLPTAALADLPDLQARYDLVVAHLLTGSISLGRAAELLDLSWLDLRTRCVRLELPLPTTPTSPEEAMTDADAALRWTRQSQA